MSERETPMSQPPRTLWEDSDGTCSGVSVQVRAAAMPWGAETRGAVAVTFRAPGNSFNAFDVVDDGQAVLVTMLVNPDEARGLARWLGEAAGAADEAGPPIFQLAPAEDEETGEPEAAQPAPPARARKAARPRKPTGSKRPAGPKRPGGA